MSTRNFHPAIPASPAVVGTVHSPGSLRAALRLRHGQVDLLELRIDEFARNPRPLWRTTPQLARIAPLLITVRHPAEGGKNTLTPARRRELFAEFLPWARLIDIELRSAKSLAGVIDAARARGTGIIISDHHFETTPRIGVLDRRARAAFAAGADLFKIATTLRSELDLATLFAFARIWAPRSPVSIMGMGDLGKISRLLLARLGSRLNYGYLDKPNAPGQWEATLLKARIAEVCAGK